MKARVATFETTDHELLTQWVEEMQDLAEDGMPRGVPATATVVLYREDGSKVISINLFEPGRAGQGRRHPPGDGPP